MIFPTITSLSITAINAVDTEMELGSLALGATKTQTNFKVVLASAKSGIFAGAILGIDALLEKRQQWQWLPEIRCLDQTFHLIQTEP